ncbi:MAG TPA: CvpA family protein [Pontiella sp.]|nr:CvpA family protein [Pontiella sp.]
MHVVIDILSALVLLFFFMSGWRKGWLLSILGVIRVILAYGAAYFAGRYLGYWFGGVFHRPRIVMIPVVAGLTFVVITFIFHIKMWSIRERHREKEEKEEYRMPWQSGLIGGTINLAAGLLSLVFIFWLGDLFMTGVAGRPLPGAEKSVFGRFARRTTYECIYFSLSREGHESQAAAMARVISNPAKGMSHLERVLSADSVQQILTDRQFAKDLLSGDPERIEQNQALNRLFDDRATLEEFRELGLVSGKETKSGLCEKLSRFGSNPNIQISIENLKTKQLLQTSKILQLIRDPDFDVIVSEVVK